MAAPAAAAGPQGSPVGASDETLSETGKALVQLVKRLEHESPDRILQEMENFIPIYNWPEGPGSEQIRETAKQDLCGAISTVLFDPEMLARPRPVRSI